MLNRRTGGQAVSRSEQTAEADVQPQTGSSSDPLTGRPPDRPSALLPVYAQFPVRPVRGRGSWLIDENGDEWLDAYGGHAVAATGHSHPHVVRAVQEQAEDLLFYSSAVPHFLREKLAAKLVELCPEPLSQV